MFSGSTYGDDPVGAVRVASVRPLAMVAAAPDDAKVGTPFGEQTLADWLRSRTAELVLHGMDLAADIDAPPEALVECGCFLLERAVPRGSGQDAVRALSGRATLPAGFSVY